MNAPHQIVLATPIALALWALPAYAQNAQQAGGQSDQEPGRTGHAVNDEIQVYNAEIAKVGQWTIQFHNNYAINGRKEPDFEGGIIPNHALNGTPELAYGITEWWEIGFYAPYAVDQNGQVLSNAGKIRQLFVTPNAAQRSFFYGVNFELSYATPRFSEPRWNLEIMSSSSIRSLTSDSARTAAPPWHPRHGSHGSSAKISRLAARTTPVSAPFRACCRSTSSSTTSMPSLISRLAAGM